MAVTAVKKETKKETKKQTSKKAATTKKPSAKNKPERYFSGV